jgi:hypothetical protein
MSRRPCAVVSVDPNPTFRWWEGLVCGCVVVAAICGSHPYAEMGFIDDWSYVKTVFEYARTGHFVYNGWATAMLGWQIPWGALFVKLFGYSFTAARLSMLPVDLAAIWLFYSILERFGIERRNAVFGTLTLGLSPLFIPLGASYMTDVPGLFVILLCLYLCLRAIDARNARNALLWLALAAGTNVAGGTVRQIAWLGALVMVPSTAWLMRRRQRALVTGALLWAFSAAGIFACLRWWNRQPYGVPERIAQGPVSSAMVAHLGAELLKALLCTCLLVFPLLIAWLPRYKTFPQRIRVTLAALILALAAAAYILHLHGTLEHRVAPWLGHVIGTESMFSSTGEMLGTRAVTLNLFWRTLLSLGVIAAAGACLVDTWLCRRHNQSVADEPDSRLRKAAYLLGLYTVCYCSLLVSRGLYSFIYDRYLLGVVPVAMIVILLLYETNVRKMLSLWPFFILAAISSYAVAATHDWFALSRARVQAVALVRAQGVPLRRIQGGFDFDGWTQLENAPSVNWAAIENPPNTYRPYGPDPGLASPCRLNFSAYTPTINPEYFVVFKPMPCLDASQFGPINYHNWLPPHTRSIFIQRRPR